MSYGYYPIYYTTGQSSFDGSHLQPNQLYQNQNQQSPLSNNSDEYLFNQNSVASNWLNQGTNATYNQYQPSYGYQTPYDYNYTQQYSIDQSEDKTFTQRSSRSKLSQHESSRASQIISKELNEDVDQLTPQIEAAYDAANGKRRNPVIKRQVITVPGEPGKVQQVVRRLPTPTPDVIERIFIVKPQRDTINLVIERPRTPPAQFKDRTIYGKSRRPIINPKIVSVQPQNYYPQIEAVPNYYNYPAIKDNPQQPAGYLLAPTNYEESSASRQSFMQNDSHAQTITQLQNPSVAPTFSTNNILQPYNPPMLDMYSQQQGNYQGYQYPTGFGQATH